MIELFQEAIRPVNLPYTILFGISIFYWIFYLVGVFGSDLLDFDFDADVDAGGDVDADIDLDGGGDGGGGSGNPLGALMRFVYASEVPVTVIASTLSLAMWVISILTNYYVQHNNIVLAAALALPIFVGGLIATKIVLMPFVPLLKRAFDESSDFVEVLGQLCIVRSLEVTDRHGQVEVPLKGSPLLLNVRARAGVTLKKGEEAVVFGKDDDGTYIVAPFERAANSSGGAEV